MYSLEVEAEGQLLDLGCFKPLHDLGEGGAGGWVGIPAPLDHKTQPPNVRRKDGPEALKGHRTCHLQDFIRCFGKEQRQCMMSPYKLHVVCGKLAAQVGLIPTSQISPVRIFLIKNSEALLA